MSNCSYRRGGVERNRKKKSHNVLFKHIYLYLFNIADVICFYSYCIAPQKIWISVGDNA